MADDIDNKLLEEIRPVFPQYDKNGIMDVILMLKRRLQSQQQPVSVGSLLPLCIDYLLETNQPGRLDPANPVEPVGYGQVFPQLVAKPWEKIVHEETTNNNGIDVDDSSSCNSSSNSSNETLDSDNIRPTRFDFEMRSNKINPFSESSSSHSSSSSEDDIGMPIKYPKVVASNLKETLHKPIFIKQPTVINDIDDSDDSDLALQKFVQNFHATMPHNAVNKNDTINLINVFNQTISGKQPGNVSRSKATFPQSKVTIKNEVDLFKDALEQVLIVVPDVDPKYATDLLQQYAAENVATMANNVVARLFESPYPKKKEEVKTPAPSSSPPEKVKEAAIDYFKPNDLPAVSSPLYIDQSLVLMQNQFSKIAARDLRATLKNNGHRYAASVKYLNEKLIEMNGGLESSQSPCSSKTSPDSLRFLKYKRSLIHVPAVLDPELEKEIKFLQAKRQEISEASDFTLAVSLNTQQYEEAGQLIECGCCFGEASFEDMVQCIEGHLFCNECLRNYAQEAIFGGGKTQLACMTDGCSSNFPLSQLKKTLPENVVEKYQERLQDESLRMVELPNLVRCPFCDYAAEIPENDKVFQCQKEQCRKETCRYCKEEWKDHFGIPCNEIEKKGVTNLRVSYEEKMSMAKIRTCPKCSCGFMKTDGCNKMTCRCGTTMCYICRTAKIDYKHFCTHARDPGMKCTICNLCSLWTDPTEDDERAIREIKKEAKKESEKLQKSESLKIAGMKRSLDIGPPEEHHHAHRGKKKSRTTF